MPASHPRVLTSYVSMSFQPSLLVGLEHSKVHLKMLAGEGMWVKGLSQGVPAWPPVLGSQAPQPSACTSQGQGDLTRAKLSCHSQ